MPVSRPDKHLLKIAQLPLNARVMAAEAPRALRTAKNIGSGAMQAGDALVSPLTGAVPNALLGELQHGVNTMKQHPVATRRAIMGTALMAPILIPAAEQQYARDYQQLAQAHDAPEKTAMSVEKFFIKQAMGGDESPFIGGLTKALGSALGSMGMNALGSAGGAAYDMTVNASARRKLFEQLLKTDPIISDAIARRPDMLQVLQEAHGTMMRFAPKLSLDINAVRSFLREAVLGGSGVNYATIKNLVEAEASIAKALQPSFMMR